MPHSNQHQAEPVIKDGLATFEIPIRFPVSVDIELWREYMTENSQESGEKLDWSKAIPDEVVALTGWLMEAECDWKDAAYDSVDIIHSLFEKRKSELTQRHTTEFEQLVIELEALSAKTEEMEEGNSN